MVFLLGIKVSSLIQTSAFRWDRGRKAKADQYGGISVQEHYCPIEISPITKYPRSSVENWPPLSPAGRVLARWSACGNAMPFSSSSMPGRLRAAD